MKVSPKGIKRRESLGGGLYADENTGRLAGRKVLVWINPDQLDTIAVTDLDRREKPVFIPRVGPVPAIDGAAEYQAARAQVADHNHYGRTVYRSIEPLLADHHFRKLAADRATIEMGEELNAGLERVQVERRKKAAVSRKVADLERQLGVAPKREGANLESQARGLELLAQARELASAGDEDEDDTAHSAPAKTYTLKLPSAPAVTEKDRAIYWSLWRRVQKARPALDRHALTRRTLGCNKSHQDFTPAEHAKMIAAFLAILNPQKP